MRQNQKSATFAAICAVMSTHGIAFSEGMNVGPVFTKEMRKEVCDILVAGFSEGTIELDKQYDTVEQLRNYTTGLVSNWIRKDSRINGGSKYEPKNKGSRAGSSDQQLKALKGLLANVTTDEEKAEIQGFIDARKEELTKAKAKPVDLSVLPEALRAKYA